MTESGEPGGIWPAQNVKAKMAQSRAKPLPPRAPSTRSTRQKRAIREAFESADRPLSTEEVLERAGKHTAGLGIATVYRSIKSFLEEGWLVAIDLPGEPSRYEVAGKDHHHHFRCTRCEGVFEIPGCIKAINLSLPKGFRAEDHAVTIYGLCDRCNVQRTTRLRRVK